MKRIRILIVDDSLTVRKRLLEVISREPDLEVVAEASSGREAIDLCERLRPDVITMDVMMPIMDGLAATEFIMAHCPTPILVVSVSDNRREVLKSFDVLAAGAVEVLEKPGVTEPRGRWELTFIATLRLVARIRPIVHPGRRGRKRKTGDLPVAPEQPIVLPKEPPLAGQSPGAMVVGIGASAGGPPALARILSAMPPQFPLPILLVMHIAPEFSDGLVVWLGKQSKLTVRSARNGEPLLGVASGEVLMAQPDRHLSLSKGRLRVTADPQRNMCRPSIDTLFESLAEDCGPRAIACLLTGMGKDGAQGLMAVRRCGGQTIAQDESTSAVFGMPREAIELGAAQIVAPLDGIARAICEIAGVKPKAPTVTR